MERVQYLEALTKEYLAFARPTIPVLEQRDLDDVVEKFTERERLILAEYDVKIDLELSYELPPVGLDVTQIGRVLSNLVRNARQAMDDGGTLTLRTRVVREGVELDVEDTGIGMSESNARKVFDKSFTTKEHGTGLGLHISQEIVTQHGGTIRCRSIEGEGTTFTLFFPTKHSSGMPHGDDATTEEDNDGSS
jgi:signal transduction histidine kinase